MKRKQDIIAGLALLLICLSSCRSKKVTTKTKEVVRVDTIYKEKKVIDTLIITKQKEITKPVYFETIIDCEDQQSGKVGSGNNYTQYQIKDGKVHLKTNIDSISNNYESFYKSKFVNDSINLRKHFESKELDAKEVVKYVWPWWVYALITYGVLFTGLYLYQRFRPI